MDALGQNNLTSIEKQVMIINQDCFYHDLTIEQRQLADTGEYNFDHPGMYVLQ